MKVLILNLSSGFCNRMFPIISSYVYCKQHNIELNVVWNRNTCRSCISNTNDDTTHYDITNYYDNIPSIIIVHKNMNDLVKKYPTMHIVNMNWKNNINQSMMDYDCVCLTTVCHIVPFIKGIDASTFCPYPIKPMKWCNDYMEQLKISIGEFSIKDAIKSNICTNYDVGIHVRITDGGFKTHEKRIKNNVDVIIRENLSRKMFLCSDSRDFSIYIQNKYSRVNQYFNDDKFVNNDLGTFYGMVDLYTLSKCKQMYITPGSSFSFLSYVMNSIDGKTLSYL